MVIKQTIRHCFEHSNTGMLEFNLFRYISLFVSCNPIQLITHDCYPKMVDWHKWKWILVFKFDIFRIQTCLKVLISCLLSFVCFHNSLDYYFASIDLIYFLEYTKYTINKIYFKSLFIKNGLYRPFMNGICLVSFITFTFALSTL